MTFNAQHIHDIGMWDYPYYGFGLVLGLKCHLYQIGMRKDKILCKQTVGYVRVRKMAFSFSSILFTVFTACSRAFRYVQVCVC